MRVESARRPHFSFFFAQLMDAMPLGWFCYARVTGDVAFLSVGGDGIAFYSIRILGHVPEIDC